MIDSEHQSRQHRAVDQRPLPVKFFSACGRRFFFKHKNRGDKSNESERRLQNKNTAPAELPRKNPSDKRPRGKADINRGDINAYGFPALVRLKSSHEHGHGAGKYHRSGNTL